VLLALRRGFLSIDRQSVSFGLQLHQFIQITARMAQFER